jgi:two-component system chemotaxis sensor kinase CheA
MDRHQEVFRDEASELLTELEIALLELENTPDDADLIGRVFRAMHTIKGSGAMFGFDAIARFAHEFENVFDEVRCGKLAITKPLIDLALAARDHIRTLLEDPLLADAGRGNEILAELQKLLPVEKSDQPAPKTPEQKIESSTVVSPVTYSIRFRPNHNIFLTGANPLSLLNELRQLGDCQIIAQTDAIPPFDEMDPEACYTYWDIILTSSQGINAIKDVFIFVEDDSEIKIHELDVSANEESSSDFKKLGEILVERGDLSPSDLEAALMKQRAANQQKRIGEILVDEGKVDAGKIQSALMEQKRLKEIAEQKSKAESNTTIRVASEKLDTLVDLVGELVTVQSRLSQTANLHQIPELLAISEEVDRLTAELRDNTMSIRMLAIGTTFGKFRRLVRDLSGELGKEVEMVTEGAETELDKTVIERLNDPLVHLIRNSIDHGIESPETREAAGKPRQGIVRLSAIHSGANVLIRIEDDGAGLDLDAIRAKAVERGVIPADAILSEKEAAKLIFAPGFSTAKIVTSVSGRGVGMDVVKRTIDALRGTIDISASKGAGTIITLRLPLTLAIIEGLLVQIAKERFVMPLSVVEECVELTREQVARANGRKIANVRGELVPYISLRESFSITDARPEVEQIVVTRFNQSRVGFVVDSVIGQHQTVIKTLGKFYHDVKEVSGATILGDGSVALILDLLKLVDTARYEEDKQVKRDFSYSLKTNGKGLSHENAHC